MPRYVSSISTLAVIIITTACGWRFLISRSASSPEPSGRLMSSSTAAGRSASNEARALATVPASTVSYSHPRSASLSVQRIIGSSSTIKIFSFAIKSPHILYFDFC